MKTSYELGYEDGLEGLAQSIYYRNDDEYEAGYVDGTGDRERDQLAKSVRPVDPEAALGDPPWGFEFTGEKRVAGPGEYYLTKNGNAKKQVGVRKNNQTRHILRPL